MKKIFNLLVLSAKEAEAAKGAAEEVTKKTAEETARAVEEAKRKSAFSALYLVSSPVINRQGRDFHICLLPLGSGGRKWGSVPPGYMCPPQNYSFFRILSVAEAIDKISKDPEMRVESEAKEYIRQYEEERKKYV